MRVIYNGVDMAVVETYAFDTEPVYDDSGMNYLYSRVSIAVRAVVNGQNLVNVQLGDRGVGVNGPVMSYAFSGSGGELSNNPPSVFRNDPQNPVAPTNQSTVPDTTGIDRQIPSRLRSIRMVPVPAGITHQAIRHRLSTPRGKLYIFSGPGMETGVPAAGEKDPPGQNSLVIVESPFKTYPCDCKNGPFPRILSIHAAMGDATTFLMDWACETYINEGPDNGVSPIGALLSNNFSQTHAIDDSGYTTIATNGSAIFRADAVQGFPLTPDSNRPFLFIPIAQGFVRENIVVTGRADVTGVDYSFQDRQVPVNFPAGPYALAAKISAVHQQAITSTDLLTGALSVYEQVLGLKANRNFARGDQPDERAEKKAMRRFARMMGRAIAREVLKAPGGIIKEKGP